VIQTQFDDFRWERGEHKKAQQNIFYKSINLFQELSFTKRHTSIDAIYRPQLFAISSAINKA